MSPALAKWMESKKLFTLTGKGSEGNRGEVEVIPTGNYGIDHILIGAGGIPRGRITEIFGAPSGGKSTPVFHTIVSAQKAGQACMYIAAAHASGPSSAISSVIATMPRGESGNASAAAMAPVMFVQPPDPCISSHVFASWSVSASGSLIHPCGSS